MRKLIFGLLCAALLLAILNVSSFGAPARKGRARPMPRRAIIAPVTPYLMAPRPMMMREAPVQQPLPTYNEKTNLGGPVVGISAGWFGGIPSAAADYWVQNVLDTAKLNLRGGVRYAQGADQDGVVRKNALVFADGIYFLTDETRFKTYLGAGLNYLAYTTGRQTGSIGGEVYLGMETGSWHSGSFFMEAGYADIRTGFSPSMKGLLLNFGYKTGM